MEVKRVVLYNFECIVINLFLEICSIIQNGKIVMVIRKYLLLSIFENNVFGLKFNGLKLLYIELGNVVIWLFCKVFCWIPVGKTCFRGVKWGDNRFVERFC